MAMDGAKLRAKMHGGERVIGTMTSFIRNPRWAGVYGRLGFDYVIVDSEHSPMSRAEGADLAAAFAWAGVCPILRVPNTEPYEAIKGLDAGFHGVLVPYCETAEEVRAVVTAARHRPLKGAQHERVRDGKATLNAATAEYLASRNADKVLIIGIESQDAIENLEAILDVGGIDAIFIGPNDLSITLGIPDDFKNPKFIEAYQYIVDTAQKRGIPAGGHLFNEVLVDYWIDKGSRFILYNSDAGALQAGYSQVLSKLRGSEMAEEKSVL